MDAIERFRSAIAARKPLRLLGAGTKDFYGQSLEGDLLDVSAHRGIVSYEPTELVITARGGTPLAEIETALAEYDQMLVFEPPFIAAGATLGGAIATGLSGPRRAAQGLYYGAARDFVLGAKLMDGRGDVLTFGGQVMKNVAGYDVARLLTGSLGTLGILLEVSLKVLPKPVATQTLRLAMDEQTFLTKINTWGGKPLPITATCWYDGILTMRLEGAQAAVSAAAQALGGERVEAAADYWRNLCDQTDAFFSQSMPEDACLWRISVPSVTKPLSQLGLQGTQLIEWGGAQRWWRTSQPAAAIREAARLTGGHATLFRASTAQKQSVSVFTPLDTVQAKIQTKLKAQFDPANIFNRGRMFANA